LDVWRQLLPSAPSVLETLQHPLEQIALSPHLYLPLVWESPFRVEPVEVHLAVVVPPRFDEVAIERRIEPDRIALQRQKYILQPLGGGVPQTGEVNDVPPIRQKNSRVPILG